MKQLVVAVALLAVPSFAKAPGQTHQCMKDGQVLEKTKKECHKAGGTWEKIPTGAAKTDVKAAEPKPADAPTDAKPSGEGEGAAAPKAN